MLNFRYSPLIRIVNINVIIDIDWNNKLIFCYDFVVNTPINSYINGTMKKITNFIKATINRVLNVFAFCTTNV
jgi:hypothetical protein